MKAINPSSLASPGGSLNLKRQQAVRQPLATTPKETEPSGAQYLDAGETPALPTNFMGKGVRPKGRASSRYREMTTASNDSRLFYNAICQKEGTHYVCGFMFDPTLETVQLIRKNRPDWQAGKLNGIGGKVNEGEDSLVAMLREFAEETGYEIADQPAWSKFGRAEGVSRKDGKPFCIDYYTAVGDLKKVSATTDEVPITVAVWALQMEECLTNVQWLVPLALEHTISRGRDQKSNGRPIVNIYYPEHPIQHETNSR